MDLDWIVEEETFSVDFEGKPRKSYSLKGFEGQFKDKRRKSGVTLNNTSARAWITIPRHLLITEWFKYLDTTFPIKRVPYHDHPKAKIPTSMYYKRSSSSHMSFADGLSSKSEINSPYLLLSQRDFPLEQGLDIVKKFTSIVEHIAPKYFS